jgi:hypothetical protein
MTTQILTLAFALTVSSNAFAGPEYNFGTVKPPANGQILKVRSATGLLDFGSEVRSLNPKSTYKVQITYDAGFSRNYYKIELVNSNPEQRISMWVQKMYVNQQGRDLYIPGVAMTPMQEFDLRINTTAVKGTPFNKKEMRACYIFPESKTAKDGKTLYFCNGVEVDDSSPCAEGTRQVDRDLLPMTRNAVLTFTHRFDPRRQMVMESKPATTDHIVESRHSECLADTTGAPLSDSGPVQPAVK